MYSNPTMVREKSYQLRSSTNGQKNLLEKNLLKNIIGADGKVDRYLKNRYKVPLEPKEDFFCQGTISTNKVSDPDSTPLDTAYNQITGINTSFIKDLSFGDVILVLDTKEALQIDEIIDNQTILVSSNSNFTCTNSRFFVIPKEIVLCSTFLATKHTLLFDFEEKEFNLDSSPIFKEFENEVKPILKDLEDGKYFFENLEEVKRTSSFNRFRLYTKLNNY